MCCTLVLPFFIICPPLKEYLYNLLLSLLCTYSTTPRGNGHQNSGSCCTGRYTLQSTFPFIKRQPIAPRQCTSSVSILHHIVLRSPDFGELNTLPTFSQYFSVKSAIFYPGNYSNHTKSHVPTIEINILYKTKNSSRAHGSHQQPRL